VALIAGCAALSVRRLGIAAREDVGEAASERLPRWRDRGTIFVYCLAGTAAALVVTCELIFLRDIFGGGDSFRMNTVFKLYFQVWLLAGVAAGPALVWLLAGAWRGLALGELRADLQRGLVGLRAALTALPGAASPGALTVPSTSGGGDSEQHIAALAGAGAAPVASRLAVDAPELVTETVGRGLAIHLPERVAVLRWLRAGGIVLWMAALSGLVAAALIYPLLAVSSRTQNFTLARSLDGAAYMATDPVNAGDETAILWLNAHVAGDPVIVEAAKYDEYTHFGRVSAFTGLPTLLGWGGHELQWRVNWLAQPAHGGELEARLAAVNTIYTSTNQDEVLSTLQRYHAQLLYVGTAERQQYSTADLARFGRFLRTVYSQGGVTIYAAPSYRG
jgi:uncharacterized membrane protein